MSGLVLNPHVSAQPRSAADPVTLTPPPAAHLRDRHLVVRTSATSPLSRTQASEMSHGLSRASRGLRLPGSMTPMARITQQMLAEGEYLQAHPDDSFAVVRQAMAARYGTDERLALPYHQGMAGIQNSIETLFSRYATQQQLPDAEELKQKIDARLQAVNDQLDGQEALYQDVLNHAGLNEASRALVKKSHQAFQAMAEQWLNSGEAIFEHCLTVSTRQLAAARQAVQLAGDPAEPSPMHQAGQQACDDWQALTSYFERLVETSPQHDALHRIGFDAGVDALQQKNQGFMTGVRIFFGAGIPEGIGSSLQFIMARAYLDPRLSLKDFGFKSLGSGTVLGAAHETLDNFAKPLARELLRSAGIPQLRKVSAEDVILPPARMTASGGQLRQHTEAEMAVLNAEVAHRRQQFTRLQQGYETGTPSGDGVTFLSQGGAQLLREVLNQATSLNMADEAARVASSMVGGTMKSGLQALGKQRATYPWRGRDIPTHVTEDPATTALRERLSATWDKGLNSINPCETSSRKNYASKIWSGTEAMAVHYSMDIMFKKFDTTTLAGKAATVVMTGVQAVGLLMPFEANKPSGNEAKTDGGSRFISAVKNVGVPDRDTYSHSTEPGHARIAENSYTRVRGMAQILPQAATETTEALIKKGVTPVVRGGINATKSAAGRVSELAEETRQPVVPEGNTLWRTATRFAQAVGGNTRSLTGTLAATVAGSVNGMLENALVANSQLFHQFSHMRHAGQYSQQDPEQGWEMAGP